jgi:hypothetical protein
MADPTLGDVINNSFEQAFDEATLADSQLEPLNNDLDGVQSMIWYGIIAIFNAVLAGALYIPLDQYPLIAAFFPIMISMEIAYWPVAIGWAAIALFDSDFSRELYKATLSLSVLGPFAGNIIGFVWLFLNADASNLWANWGFWVLWPFFLVYEIGLILVDFFFLPTIFDYIETAPLATA